MIITIDRTQRATAQFNRLDSLDKGRAIAGAAALLTNHENSDTFTAIFNCLDGKEKLIIENKIASLLQEKHR